MSSRYIMIRDIGCTLCCVAVASFAVWHVYESKKAYDKHVRDIGGLLLEILMDDTLKSCRY